MADKKVTDLTYLRDISMGDDDMIVEMIEVFLEEYHDALSEMRELYEREVWAELRAKAHKFKPNLAYMGIATGTEKIVELEEYAKNKYADPGIDANLAELHDICERASRELKQELANMNIP